MSITLYRLIKGTCCYPVHFCQIAIQHDPLAADLVDLVLDYLEIGHDYDSSVGVAIWPEFSKLLTAW